VDSAPLGNGNVGVQTMNANAEFRNFTTTTGSTVITSAFVGIPAADVSGQWNPVQTGTAQAAFGLDSSNPYNTSFSQRVQFVSGTGTVGIANQGLNRWGIAVTEGSAYPGRVHLRTSGLAGAVTVSLQSADGSRIYASQSLTGVTSGWQKFPFTLIPNVTDPNARFVIALDAPGTLWIDEAVLTGSPDPDYPGVTVRPDIANAVKAGGLTFMRYGGSAANMPGYRWKQMIGDRDLRPMYEGNWHPNTSNGFAIEEFVAYCRVSGIEPAFAINIEETPQDMADMVEYLNGAATTSWGAVRAANGHPEPYGVRYIEIGNEEAIDPTLYDHYIERFKLLAPAMKAVDPGLSLVIAAWWRGDADSQRVFTALEGLADYWDIHIWIDSRYRGFGVNDELARAQALFQQWVPGAKMKVVIFEENGVTHDLERALAHATILNAVRRHADFVLVDCEADAMQAWCQNDNGWDQGHLFFTPDKVWGMPNYHLEKMAAENHLPLLVNSVVTGNPSLDVTVTKSLDGTAVCLHVVNLSPAASTATLNLANLNSINPVAEAWTISGNPSDVNTLDQPLAIQPIGQDIVNASNSFSYTFPGISYTVIRLTGVTGSSGVTGSPAALRAVEYALSQGLTGADAAATADPDADGLDNFSEWAFGTQPGLPDAGVASVGMSVTGSPVSGFRFSHRRLVDNAAAGMTYRYEVSPDMVNWHPVVPVPVSTTSLGSSFGYETAEMDLPALEVAGRTRLFLRISAPH
jgi:alpha-L-arabinofuranosidase